MAVDVREEPIVGTFPSETARRYLFDFQYFPELQAGETISNPSVPAVSGLTIGAPTITLTAMDGIPAGKAVVVAMDGQTKGDYTVECTVTFSGGGHGTIRGTFSIE